MKKFIEFAVCATSNKVIQSEVKVHLSVLGYKETITSAKYFFTFESGRVMNGSNLHYEGHEFVNNHDKITLDEFFDLTPEDVIVEPERFHCRFQFENVNYGDDISGHYTKDQVDRVKSILLNEHKS